MKEFDYRIFGESSGDRVGWDKVVDDFDGHPLQYWGWGELKSKEGWEALRVKFTNGGAQMLVKKLPLGRKMFFVPRGPFVKSSGVSSETSRAETLRDLARFASERKASILKIEPEWLESAENEIILRNVGFYKSQNRVFIPKTAEIALRNWADAEVFLASLGKKTRQYINKSTRELKILRVDSTDSVVLEEIFELYMMTAVRAGFRVHPKEYYLRLAEEMKAQNKIYGAYFEGKICAFLWNIASKTTEFELYAGVNEIGQRLRANYGLKWQAIEAAFLEKRQFYDMNGLLNDGISEFKRHFLAVADSLGGPNDSGDVNSYDGEIVRVGTWDYYPSVAGKWMDMAIMWARKIRKKGR